MLSHDVLDSDTNFISVIQNDDPAFVYRLRVRNRLFGIIEQRSAMMDEHQFLRGASNLIQFPADLFRRMMSGFSQHNIGRPD